MILTKDQIMRLNAKVFAEKTHEILMDLEVLLPGLRESPGDLRLIQRVYRAMAAFKGAGGMFGFDEVARLAHAVMRAFEPARNGEVPVPAPLLDLTLSAGQHIRMMVEIPARESRLEDNGQGEGAMDFGEEEAQRLINLLEALRREQRSAMTH